jgi:hypothetical protein
MLMTAAALSPQELDPFGPNFGRPPRRPWVLQPAARRVVYPKSAGIWYAVLESAAPWAGPPTRTSPAGSWPGCARSGRRPPTTGEAAGSALGCGDAVDRADAPDLAREFVAGVVAHWCSPTPGR